MDQQKMIDDLIRLLDEGTADGVGHVNVSFDPALAQEKHIRTGGPECSAAPLACSVPTLHEGLDRKE